MTAVFVRDRFTWVAYLVLAWFAFLQAAPGQVVPHLREDLDLSYTAGGLYVAAFAAGCTIAGMVAARLERVLGGGTLLWVAAAVMAAGAVGLTVGRTVELTLGAVLVMGLGGGLLLSTGQAALAAHHGPHRAVALAELNIAASLGYLALTGVLFVAAATSTGWRVALLVPLAVPVVLWWTNRSLPLAAPPAPADAARAPLPRVLHVAAAMLFCTTAAEWCTVAWGATYVADGAGVPTDTAVALMAGYFGGVLAGRVLGARLARTRDPARLLGGALAVSAAGMAVLWPAQGPATALLGLTLLGVGLGNLFPMGTSLAVSLAPDQAAATSGRVVAASSFAVVLAPVALGALADATSITVALAVVPVMLALAAAALGLLQRARPALGASRPPVHAG